MTDYDLLVKQCESFAEDSSEWLPLMANTSALLFDALDDVNWAGFYMVKGDELILGPFQGKVACMRIGKGRGVCGTAWEEDKVQLVADVHEFPGHIACDSASNSEIVIPIHNGGKVVAVLDIDSPLLNRFSEEDRSGLMSIADVIEKALVAQ